MASDSTLTEIRNRLDLVDIVSDYVSLKKAGTNYKGLCPFHSEKTASFIVSPEKQIYHCFGCHEGGDLFGFLMKIDGLTFPEAIEKLASKAGVQIQSNKKNKIPKNEKEILYQANRIAAWHYHETLKKSKAAEKAREYLSKRGITSSEIEKFRLGFSPNQANELIRIYQQRKVPIEAAEKVGVLRKGERGYFENFRERITFPIFNTENKVVGLGGRILESQREVAKYINSPDSLIYDKSSILFGFPLAKEAIRKKKRVFIVEGYLDLITMHQFGFEETVAPLGTALTSKQIALLKRYTTEIIILFDSDEAGWKATSRSLELFLEQDLYPKVLILPLGEDPDSYLRKVGSQLFEEKVKETRNLLSYLADKIIAENKRDIAGKSSSISQLRPYFLKISSLLKRNLYIRAVAEKLDIPETWILEELGLKPISSKGGKREEAKPKSPTLEETLVELFLKFESVRPVLLEKLKPNDFESDDLRKITTFLWNEKEFKNFSWSEILNKLEETEIKNKLTQLVLRGNTTTASTAFQIAVDCIDKMKRRDFKQNLKLLSLQIKEAENEGRVDQLKNLLREKQTLIERTAKEK